LRTKEVEVRAKAIKYQLGITIGRVIQPKKLQVHSLGEIQLPPSNILAINQEASSTAAKHQAYPRAKIKSKTAFFKRTGLVRNAMRRKKDKRKGRWYRESQLPPIFNTLIVSSLD